MSKTIDEKVVSMQFDNRQFESAVSSTLNTIEKLKQKLNFTGASKGLEDIGSSADKLKQKLNFNSATKSLEEIGYSAKKVDFSALSHAIDSVAQKFSALEVVCITTLANITNSAVNAGKKIVSALTLDPVSTGLKEYETKMNSIQVIQANTRGKNTMSEITDALDDLNTYADNTIYNFAQMTDNIGKFTAQGLDVKQAADAVKGMANLAAASGASATDMARATYQMSQALGGTIRKIDWNSLRNANMATTTLKDTLIDLAKVNKIDIDSMIKNKGTFEDTLEEGWLTGSLFTEAMNIYSGVYSEAELKAKGFNDAQVKNFMDLAKMAESAATEVKTISQLWDVLKETAQSGWTQSWEYIIGDFESAKSTLTKAQIYFSGLIGEFDNARNDLLKGWNEKGGRDTLIESLKSGWTGLLGVITPIKEAFKEIFPEITVDTLINFTNSIKKLADSFRLSSDNADRTKRIFKGLFSIVSILGKAIKVVVGAFYELATSEGFKSFANSLYEIIASIGDFFTTLKDGINSSGIAGAFTKIVSTISNILKSITGGVKSFTEVLSSLASFLGEVFEDAWGVIEKVFGWISDNTSSTDLFSIISGTSVALVSGKIIELVTVMKESIESFFKIGDKAAKIKQQLKDLLDGVHESLQTFTSGVKVSSLLAIAIAIGILAASMETISKLDISQIAKSLGSLGLLLVGLIGFMKKLLGVLSKFKDIRTKSILSSAIAILIVAAALKKLANAMVIIAELKFNEILKGLGGLFGGMIILIKGLKSVAANSVDNLKSAFSIVILAYACKVIAGALVELGKMPLNEIGRSLTAMGGAMLELLAVLYIMKKIDGGIGTIFSAVSILIISKSLSDIADALIKFGSMQWPEIGRGLTAMGGALVELAVVVGLLGYFAGFGGIIGAASIYIVTQALDDIANALIKFGSMQWSEIGRGLTAMGGALVELAVVVGLLGYFAGFGGIIGAASIYIVTQALDDIANALIKFGGMQWDEIGRGLTAMGGALAEIAVVVGLLGYFAGFAGIIGGASIYIVTQTLDDIANALIKFGSMQWDEIGRGLTAMGGALAEIAIIEGLLGSFAGFAGIIGGASIYIVTQTLDDIANALIKFGGMQWDEIERGLSAMGGALAEVGIGGLLNTLSGLGAYSLSSMIDPLDKLADVLKKYAEIDADQLESAVSAMSSALGAVGLGGIINTLSLLGSLSIETIAEPIGTLADSVKKWEGVSVPDNLPEELSIMASAIRKFLFTSISSSSLSKAAEPIGTLADSVKKWEGVSVPDNLPEELSIMASAIRKFLFTFFSTQSIKRVAEPLGVLAESMKKWNELELRDGLTKDIETISDSIKKFDWMLTAGFSMSQVVDPLKQIPESLKAWNDIKFPEGIDTKLETLSTGIKNFEWLFLAGGSLSTIVDPLKSLPDALKKWKDVELPEGIDTKLETLANGVEKFSFAFLGGWSIDSIASPLGKLADSVKKWNAVKISEDFGDKLSNFGSNILTLSQYLSNACNGVSSSKIDKLSDSISKLNTSISGITLVDESTINSFVSAINKLEDIKIDESAFASMEKSLTSSIESIMSSINNTIENSKTSVSRSMLNVIDGMINTISKTETKIKNSSESLMIKFKNGITANKNAIASEFKNNVSKIVSAVRDKYSSMYNAGKYLGEGLVIGINSKQQAAYDAGYALGKKAVQGEKDGQNSKSPSKLTIKAGKWLGEGLIIGMNSFSDKVYNAGYDMGENAVDSISSSIAKITDVINSDIDTQPTIRPILDLSDVTDGANTINGIFGMSPTIGVMSNIRSISSMMANGQNGGNDDVISAIKDLGGKLGKTSGDTYNLNGITYDDGSEISNAVKLLVRAAKIERRI